MPKTTLKPQGLSREEFDRLPPLISRATFMLATGLNHVEIWQMANAGELKLLPVGRTKTRCKYYKADAARLAGYIATTIDGRKVTV